MTPQKGGGARRLCTQERYHQFHYLSGHFEQKQQRYKDPQPRAAVIELLKKTPPYPFA